MHRHLAVVAVVLLGPGVAGASTVSGSKGYAASVLWSSGTIADSTSKDSPVLDLSRIGDIEVFVDNTSGTGFRDVTLVSFGPDGVTTIGSVPVAKVAWGAAANGAVMAPGYAHGYLGPNAPGTTSGIWALYDVTSAANAALDTTLHTQGCDYLWVTALPSGGTTQLTSYDVDDGGVATKRAGASSATASQVIAWGVGQSIQNGGIATDMWCASPVLRRAQFTTTAAGVGNTTRLRVWCKGRPPGTFSVQMVLPVFGKFQVSSATGTASVVVVGR